MKNTKKITFCAIMAALAAVMMLGSYFMYLTYAIPAIAGLCIMVIVVEFDCKWALLTYITSSFLTFLFAEFESKVMFIAFFGFYPIVKCLVEKIKKPTIEWIIKYLIFNICIVGAYSLFASVLLDPSSFKDMGAFAKYAPWILLVMANVTFAIYDIAISKLCWLYLNKLHKKFARLLK